MYEIIFYHDKNGYEPVKEYIDELSVKCDKNSRIKCNKIRQYIKILQNYGTSIGEPYILNAIFVFSLHLSQASFIYFITSRANGVADGSVWDLPVIYFTHS